jgi:hypothetical protein
MPDMFAKLLHVLCSLPDNTPALTGPCFGQGPTVALHVWAQSLARLFVS